MSLPDPNPMPIIGYCDPLSAQPGQVVKFMVSCDYERYSAEMVRLRHVDPNPKGPGFKEERVVSKISGDYNGKKETYPQGSYVKIPLGHPLSLERGFSVQAWISPTRPQRARQAVITVGGIGQSASMGLFVDVDGSLSMILTNSEGTSKSVSGGKGMRASTWYFVACSYDAATGEVLLLQEPVSPLPRDESRSEVTEHVGLGPINPASDVLLIAASPTRGEKSHPAQFFNGKIDRPSLFARPLNRGELLSLASGATIKGFGGDVLGCWDFTRGIGTDMVLDRSEYHRDGRAINSPQRAVTGHNWSGDETDFRIARDQYGAIHFHDDDLDDCHWRADFEFRIPEDFQSGTYAAKLTGGGYTEYVPFFVRPKKGTANSKIAFLAPTLTSLAYGNGHGMGEATSQFNFDLRYFNYPHTDIEKYLQRANLLGLYDKHSDDSGVCYASRLRPVLTMRPQFRDPLQGNGRGSPHCFSADFWITDWMDAKGFRYDTITDEDVHADGMDLLRQYRVIVTGTHPEYWTGPMLEALEQYLRDGGRLMYLGGNGFYWVTGINDTKPHVVEIRRWGGTQAWRSEVGEVHLSSTGEQGGLWKDRNRAPQKLVGVGFTAMGVDPNKPFKRLRDSFNPKAAFIFEGVGEDELIGDFPCLDQEYGAAGYEFDRYDYALGTPQNTLILATAAGYSDGYQHVVEDLDGTDGNQGGSKNELVRTDMVYLEYPNQGAVFSTSCITWAGCLYYNGYANNVSRITENVLRKFSTSEELP